MVCYHTNIIQLNNMNEGGHACHYVIQTAGSVIMYVVCPSLTTVSCSGIPPSNALGDFSTSIESGQLDAV